MKTIILIIGMIELCRGFPAKETIVDLKPPQFESTYDSYLNSPIFTLQVPGLAPAKNFNGAPDQEVLSQDLKLPSLEPYNPNNDPNLYFNQGETYNVRKSGKKSTPGKKYERGSDKKPTSPKAVKYQNHKYYDDGATASSYRLEKAPAQSPYDIPSPDMSEILPIISAILKNQSNDFNERSFNNEEASESLNLEHRLSPEEANDRLQFEMHGHNGPHSYKFGFDTGKGHDRQFRYEERDNEGVVHGHYGYYEKDGKLRVVNYKAHPKDGFSAGDDQE